MKSFKFYLFIAVVLTVTLAFGNRPASAQLKIGYINSNKILETYKEAVDVRKQLQEINAQWENEAKDMQKEIQELLDQLESQSLLLSDERKQAKQQEIQNLNLKYQRFLQEKWGPQGELAKKEAELLKPVFDKINEAIRKIGNSEGFSYIFDVINSNILFASEDQPDLTDRLFDELNKGLPAQSNPKGK
ncbi:MAG: OmpH family outer membrane protein [bacterium]